MVEQTDNSQLKQVFAQYSTDSAMEGKQFVKVFNDLKLLDAKFTTTEVDLIFAKIKEKKARKICLAEFVNGVDLVA